MNIVEAFNKLKENPNLVIKFKNIKYRQISGIIYSKTNDDDRFYEIGIDEIWFSVFEVLSNDWEVI